MIKAIHKRIRKIIAEAALMSVELIIVWALFIVSFVVFILVADAVFLQKKDEFDNNMFSLLGRTVSPGLTVTMQAVTFLGTYQFLVPANIILILYFLLVKRHRWYSIKVPVVALGGLTLMYMLKKLFNRPRPLVPLLAKAQGLSFPSGHALMSVAFFGLLIFIVQTGHGSKPMKWTVSTFLVLLILAIGLSRIYLRVHYASDVIAGFTVGILWLTVSLWTTQRLERFSKRKVDPVVEEKTGVLQ